MSDQPPELQTPAALADLYRHIAKITQTLLNHADRISAIEDGLEEDLPEEEEDHPPLPRKGHPTQVLLGTSKAARKAYQQKTDSQRRIN